ncbi:MAG TPA: hypothetical protein VLA74_03080, partial [Nitrososphaeraceae archaeon]|nr:hypothetical protein [Nitrososphaeraceae archaeon]
IMQFCLAVKSIQNIHGNTLPFIGIILAKPSSLKTTIIELFRKYDGTFYSDNFTQNSMMSHNSSLSEEELQKVDMLPKMNNKFVLTPELAPIFTAKDDDLQKVLGIITRIVDGKGYESDSGAQGHRKYSDIMFSWVGAAVEIPPKVWKLLSQLGFKLYFFRPNLQEKSVNDLTTIIKDNDYILKNKEIEEALLDYLRVFDAAPTTDFTTLDGNGIVKVKWNFDSSRNDIIEKEQKKVLEYIAQIAKLLAPLRGTVYVSQSKTRKYQKSQNSSNNGPDEEISYQTEELDYEVDSPIIEDPSRAAVVLRNLAIANAISQGRNYFVKEDIKLIIKVALSTTRIHRSKLLELLLKNNGELTTSKIVNELAMSEPSARKTMREFEALGIVKTSRTSASVNSELKIKMSHEFQWFLSDEFRELCKPSIIEIHPDHSRDSIYCNNNVRYQSFIIKNLCSNYYYNTKSCTDNNNNYCHTLKQNLPPEGEIKNNNDSILITNNNTISKFSNNDLKSLENKENKINFNHKTYNDSKKVENYTIQEKNDDIINNPNSSEDKGSINENSLQKNSASLGPENFQHVTASQEKCHIESKINHKDEIPEDVIEDILQVIRDENGSIISLAYALQLACQRSEVVSSYLKDEKLTSRDSRKVRNLFVEINRHPKIEVVKRKPELVVKWIKEEVIINN